MGWVAVGVGLILEAVCLVAIAWLAPDILGGPPERVPTTAASGAVAIAFVAAGLGALFLGVRKVIAVRGR